MLIKLWIQIHVKCFEINSSLQKYFFLYLYDFEHFFFRKAHFLVSIYKYKSGTNFIMIINFILTGNLRNSNTSQNLTIEEDDILYKSRVINSCLVVINIYFDFNL